MSIRVERGVTNVVHLDGELCPDTAPWFEEHLAGAFDAGSPWVALDAGDLRLLSAAGISVILDADRRATALGGGVWMTRPSDAIRRALQACDLDRLAVEPTRDPLPLS